MVSLKGVWEEPPIATSVEGYSTTVSQGHSPGGQQSVGAGLQPASGLSVKEGKKRFCNANRNERAWGRSLLCGPDMGMTQNH